MRITICLIFLVLLISTEASALNPPGKGKPKRGNGGRKRPANGSLQPRRQVAFFNVDVFAGPSLNFISGPYLDIQKQYYQDSKTKFPTDGTMSSYFWFSGGAQVRINPIEDSDDPLSMISGSVGLAYLQKGFTHDVTMQNKNLDYDDFTNLHEVFKAHYLSIPIACRFGGSLYAEGGICLDVFMNGTRTQTMNRWAESDTSAQIPLFAETYTSNSKVVYNLPSALMKKVSLGYVFGGGYSFVPGFGIRIYNTVNSNFFKDAKLRNFQTSIQLIGTFN